MGMQSAWRIACWMTLGVTSFTRSAFESCQRQWADKEPVLMRGKRVIITGANQGIGYATAEAMAAAGAHVCLLVRSQQRGERAKSKLYEITGNPDISVALCDVSSLADIHTFASEYVSSNKTLYALINNAGCMMMERTLTPEGVEANFATNTLGMFALTEMLLPALERTEDSRVVVVSSGGMLTVPLEQPDEDHNKIDTTSHFDGTNVYAINKRQQVALTEVWSRQSPHTIGFYSMHPGWADTAAVRQSMPEFHKHMQGRLRSAAQGADTVAWLAMTPGEKLTNGAFYLDRAVAKKHISFGGTAYTDSDAEKLFATLRRYTTEITSAYD